MSTPATNVTPIGQPQPLGEMIARMLELREQKKALEAQVKGINEEFDSLEAQLILLLDTQESTTVATKQGTATITETVVPVIADWDAFENYVITNGALHLLQRRPATAAFRELQEAGEAIPGLEPFTKRAISLRKK